MRVRAKLVGRGVLKGDRAVGDCFGTAAGLDEELGQVGAQPDVIGRGFYGTCQGFDKGIGHPVSLEAGDDANPGTACGSSLLPLVRPTCRARRHVPAH